MSFNDKSIAKGKGGQPPELASAPLFQMLQPGNRAELLFKINRHELQPAVRLNLKNDFSLVAQGSDCAAQVCRVRNPSRADTVDHIAWLNSRAFGWAARLDRFDDCACIHLQAVFLNIIR